MAEMDLNTIKVSEIRIACYTNIICASCVNNYLGEWANKGGILVRMFRNLVKKRNKSAVAAMERKKRSKALSVFGIPLSILVCSLLLFYSLMYS